jgi:urease accessory protein UreE
MNTALNRKTKIIASRQKFKINNVTLRHWNHQQQKIRKEHQLYVEIHIYLTKQGKNNLEGDFILKLTVKHFSLIYEDEEKNNNT